MPSRDPTAAEWEAFQRETGAGVPQEYAPSDPTPEEWEAFQSEQTPSLMESRWRGLARGLTFGGIEKGAAALESLPGIFDPSEKRPFGQRYEESLDKYKGRYDAAQEANPETFDRYELGGSVASSVSPGMGKALSFIPGGPLAKSLAGGFGTSVLQQQFETDETDAKQRAFDAFKAGGQGAALAGVAHGATKAISAGARAAHLPELYDYIGKKARGGIKAVLGPMGGVRPETIKAYTADNIATNAARVTPEIAEETQKRIEDLSKLVNEGSKAAAEKLPLERIPLAPYQRAIDNARKLLVEQGGRPTAEGAQPIGREALAALEAFQRDFNSRIARTNGKLTGTMPAREIKRHIQNLDNITSWDSTKGGRNELVDRIKQSIRLDMDESLKLRYPEYEKAMLPVADNMRALAVIDKFFGRSKDVAAQGIKRAGREESKTAEQLARQGIDEPLTAARQGDRQQALKELSNRTESASPYGKDILKEEQRRDVLNQFYQDATRGSKGVNLGKALGDAAKGVAMGGGIGATIGSPALAGVLGGLGAIGGVLRDSYGPQWTKKIIDSYQHGDGKTRRMLEAVSRAVGATWERNPVAISASWDLLLKQYPELRAILESEQ